MSKSEAISILKNNLARAETRRQGEIERRDFDAARRTEWYIDDVRAELNKFLDSVEA